MHGLVVGQTFDHGGDFAQVVAVGHQLGALDIISEQLLVAVHDDTALCGDALLVDKFIGSNAAVVAGIHNLQVHQPGRHDARDAHHDTGEEQGAAGKWNLGFQRDAGWIIETISG